MMSCYIEPDVAAAVARLRTLSWPVLCREAIARLRSWRQRQREREELLLFMGSDHRAAADIGVTRYEALSLSNRPFWRDQSSDS
jgi:uncharacterized protein YjiS (DUF1127 family)